jgi:hypothetical protein
VCFFPLNFSLVEIPEIVKSSEEYFQAFTAEALLECNTLAAILEDRNALEDYSEFRSSLVHFLRAWHTYVEIYYFFLIHGWYAINFSSLDCCQYIYHEEYEERLVEHIKIEV